MLPETEAALEDLDAGEIEVWPDMVPAVSLFIAMETQWRWVGAGMAGVFRTGLDYASLPGIAAMLKVEMSPDVLADLRSMESAALEQWSRQ